MTFVMIIVIALLAVVLLAAAEIKRLRVKRTEAKKQYRQQLERANDLQQDNHLLEAENKKIKSELAIMRFKVMAYEMYAKGQAFRRINEGGNTNEK